MSLLSTMLSKVDYRVTGTAYSRPQYQVKLIVDRLLRIRRNNKAIILDLGGGINPQYKPILSTISSKYYNLEIKAGPGVDIVGECERIPTKDCHFDIVTMFMVLEHINNPSRALAECHRVLKNNGLVALTTVQYWHTHNHPNDYFRYTKSGLEYLFESSGYKLIDIWSIGGPFLVIFHVIELNLPDKLRVIYSIMFYRFFDILDSLIFNHNDIRKYSDSVGWAVIARKV